MKLNEVMLTFKLLKLASEHFGNHGCNDFDLAAVMPDVAERRSLMRAYHQWNGDPQEFDPANEYRIVPDFMLMGFMAAKVFGDGVR